MDPIKAATELLNRRTARESFWEFCKYVDSEFFNDRKPHLVAAAKKLQSKIYPRSNQKIMTSMPPRAGKSYLITMFCAWLFGNYPDISIMRNSYGATLSETFSRQLKTIIQLPKYHNIFPDIEISKDHAGVDDWALTTAKTTSYFCAGVGGPVTGKGCDIAILDDPIKNYEDASSETVINKTWKWKQSTHDSRKEKNCPEIIIATRWSLKDPSGMALETQPGEWDELIYPAIIDGQSFCEDIKSTEEYLAIKSQLDTVIWEAEYMQNPIEVTGLLYPADSLVYFERSEVYKIVSEGVLGYTDTADEGTDYLASAIGKISGSKIYVIDVIYTQDPVEVTEGLVASQILINKPNYHIVEANAGGRIFAINLSRLNKNPKVTVSWKQSTTNKITRMIMQSGYIKANFRFLDKTEYKANSDYDKFMQALTSTTKTKNRHDDAADCVTGLAELSERITNFQDGYVVPEDPELVHIDAHRAGHDAQHRESREVSTDLRTLIQ